MSYKSLLRMRANILEVTQGQQDGMTFNSWVILPGNENVRVFLDLGYSRPGRDPIWTPETNLAQNRTGVLFLSPKTLAQPGGRVQITKGPPGTFEIKSSIDEVWTPHGLHHLECFVQEIDRVLAES